ncbi:cyclic nucleotide-binding domain-containing protein [Actinoplanes sp. NPDC049118]|uniref:cyclic nucleotide-binding domain-containing protein n=1 Tax=Actinoplanes sp. NPDC049118 TaxID=3155769 RepID=UPI0033D4D2FB
MTDDVVDRVAALPFFAALNPQQLRQLCEAGMPASYQPGERIFAEGGTADRFWLIETGDVALDIRVPGRGDQVIETLAGGAVLGWSWLHPPYRWQFGASARERVEAIAFDAATVRDRCDADPVFGYAMLRLFTPVITERLQATRLRLLDLYATAAQVGRP